MFNVTPQKKENKMAAKIGQKPKVKVTELNGVRWIVTGDQSGRIYRLKLKQVFELINSILISDSKLPLTYHDLSAISCRPFNLIHIIDRGLSSPSLSVLIDYLCAFNFILKKHNYDFRVEFNDLIEFKSE